MFLNVKSMDERKDEGIIYLLISTTKDQRSASLSCRVAVIRCQCTQLSFLLISIFWCPDALIPWILKKMISGLRNRSNRSLNFKLEVSCVWKAQQTKCAGKLSMPRGEGGRRRQGWASFRPLPASPRANVRQRTVMRGTINLYDLYKNVVVLTSNRQ